MAELPPRRFAGCGESAWIAELARFAPTVGDFQHDVFIEGSGVDRRGTSARRVFPFSLGEQSVGSPKRRATSVAIISRSDVQRLMVRFIGHSTASPGARPPSTRTKGNATK